MSNIKLLLIPCKTRARDRSQLYHGTSGIVLDNVVAVAFQIIFCAEIHANDFFYF